MRSLDDVVLDPEFVGGTISHEQLEECNHKGQHLIEDCGLDLSALGLGEGASLKDLKNTTWTEWECGECEAQPGEACAPDCELWTTDGCDCPTCEAHKRGETVIGEEWDAWEDEWVEDTFAEDTQTKSTNPKDILAREEQRVLLHLIPSPGLVHTALAMMDGARKYGPYNWREEGVGAGTYISAAQRHLRDWLDGEECAPDSGTHHLGHAAACLMILMDAQAVGNLVDDRPAPAPTAEMMEEVKRSGKAEDAHWLNLPDYEPDYSCLEDQEDEGREEYGPGGCAV